MVCRCEYTFCSKHRYPEEHKCDFNFDNFYKKKLESENQKVAVKKIDKMFWLKLYLLFTLCIIVFSIILS